MKLVEGILQELKPELDLLSMENYIENGALDSFDIIVLVSTLDEVFHISIDGTDIIPENFNSLESIKSLVGKYCVVQ